MSHRAIATRFAPLPLAMLGVLALAGCGSRSDSTVANDLASLIASKSNLTVFIKPSRISCAHQSGNEYTCGFTYKGQQVVVSVQDDGHTIAEEGFHP